MAKKIMQFRYYGENNLKNYPAEVNLTSLKSGSIFEENDCYPIIQLGIQSLPGTHFYLNNANTSIKIGSTGIYELDLEGYAEITKLAFAEESLNLISENPNAYLIVDMICNKQEAKQ